MITNKDVEIIKYIEEFGFITIGQCYEIWYRDRKYGYDLARKELNKLIKAQYLNGYKDTGNIYAEKIFFLEDKFKRPSRSMILVQNVYSELCKLGAEILYFKREEEWLKQENNNHGKYRSDGFVIFNLGGYVYSSFIEVIDCFSSVSYNLQKKQLSNKYQDIYDSREATNKIKQITNIDKEFMFPTLLIVDEVDHKSTFEMEDVNIVKTNFKLEKLSTIFI
jgi:hypothetical protein